VVFSTVITYLSSGLLFSGVDGAQIPGPRRYPRVGNDTVKLPVLSVWCGHLFSVVLLQSVSKVVPLMHPVGPVSQQC
jgi:hypothetical protein